MYKIYNQLLTYNLLNQKKKVQNPITFVSGLNQLLTIKKKTKKLKKTKYIFILSTDAFTIKTINLFLKQSNIKTIVCGNSKELAAIKKKTLQLLILLDCAPENKKNFIYTLFRKNKLPIELKELNAKFNIYSFLVDIDSIKKIAWLVSLLK